MKLFESQEIYLFAIRIEENGEKFYRHAAQIAQDKETRDMFLYLANQEVDHKKTFEGMLSKLERREIEESYPGEYLAYLQDYLDNRVIFSQKAMGAEFGEVRDTLSAIDFAIRREVNSVLFYHEMKRAVAECQHEAIDQIIEEERKHFLQLADLKKNYERKER